MKPVRVRIYFLNGNLFDDHVGGDILRKHDQIVARRLTGKALIHQLWSDDFGPPPLWLSLFGTKDNGQPFDMSILYR